MNGEVLTDFPFEALPPEVTTGTSRGARKVIRVGDGSRVRISAGGPQLHFENINGDILVRRD